MKKLLWVGIALVLVLSGCDLLTRSFSLSEEDFPDKDVGRLLLYLPGGSAVARAIYPTDDMIVSEYDIALTKSGATPITATVDAAAGGAVTEWEKNGIEPGDWTLSVAAYDSLGDQIGKADDSVPANVTVTLNGGYTTSKSVQIVPMTGMGRLTLSLAWPPSALNSPVGVRAFLVPADDANPTEASPETTYSSYELLADAYWLGNPGVVVTEATRIATFDSDNPSTGAVLEGPEAGYYYYLYMAVYEGSPATLAARLNPQSVRVAYDKLTAGTLALQSGDGGVALQILLNMQDQILISWVDASDVAMTPPTTLTQGSFFTIKASPEPSTPYTGHQYSYQWYLDGLPLSGQTSATLANYGASLAVGVHTLGVMLTESLTALPNTVRTISSQGFTLTVTQ